MYDYLVVTEDSKAGNKHAHHIHRGDRIAEKKERGSYDDQPLHGVGYGITQGSHHCDHSEGEHILQHVKNSIQKK